jgi:hypothetical protein
MKKLTYLLTLVVIFSSCSSSKKLMQKGNYDGAIGKSVKELRKNPDNAKQADILDRSYKIANERDNERIKFLKRENNPNNWDEVFILYSSLQNRQSLVRTVLPLNIDGRNINYPYVDYDAEIIAAKNKAADYFYQNAQQLIKLGTKEGYRQAYDELMKASKYTGGQYLDIDRMIEEAQLKGMSRALVLVNNMTHINLDPVFVEDLLEINTDGLESPWVEYHFKDLDEQTNYDYTIFINLESIMVSPDNVKESDKIYKKEIQDGFDYVLDARGNVMKDTAGNDIKVPKYKTLSCTVIETHQNKTVRIEGNAEFLSNNPRKLLKKEPIGAENVFDHKSARAVGDIEALDSAARELIKSEYIPFPNDMQMIFNTTQTLKPAIRDAIYRNRRYIF